VVVGGCSTGGVVGVVEGAVFGVQIVGVRFFLALSVQPYSYWLFWGVSSYSSVKMCHHIVDIL